jgi:hypothetical protein
MATLQGKAVKNTYRQVLQIGANNVGVSGTLQPVQDGAGINTALSLSTNTATINGTLTITGDLIITGGGIQIQDLIDDTVASLIQNGTGITWAYNDTLRTLTPTITIATADGGVQGDFLQLNVNANEASAVGKLKWNTTDGTMDIGLMGGNVVLQVGQEQVARVVNNSGTNFTEAGYQAVKITSAQGQRLAVGLAQANNEANSKDTLGLVTENIANNQEGFVTTSGLVRQIDTTGDLQTEVWVDGDTLYLSPTVPGRITKVKPLAPNQTVIVGFVVYAHKNQGKIFVKVDNGYELNELHDVRITSVANNNVLKYNSSLAVWENVAPITTWITEGTNLYYTQGRFDSAFAAKSTTNLAEGTNLYFTTARGDANFATNFATKTTTNLPEGTNLYFTNQRFDTRFGTKTTTDLTEGTNLYYTQARFNTAFDAKTTTDLDEGTNLYYTDARARLALASSATGLTYANNSGVFSLTAGYAIPTTVKLGQYDIAYNRSIVSAAVTGTSTKTLSLTQQDANVITATWTDQGITTINGTANQIAATTVGNTTTLAFTNDVTMPNNLVVSGNLTINGTATYVNTQSISAKDPLFEVANDNNTTDAVDIGYYGRFYDSIQTRVEFTGLFRDASDAGKFKFFTGLVDEPTNVVNTTGTGYTVGTLVANFEGNLAGTANAANALSTARTIAASGDATWSVSFDGSANVSSALTLANTGVTATTYGTSTAVPTIAIDAKGRITSASNTNIAFPVTTVNGQAGTVVLTTANVAEGGSNLYFTTARAQSAITLSTTGTSGAATYTSGNINVPIYIGGSGTANQIAYFDTTGTISSLATATYPSLTELSYVKGVTSAIQTQINTKAADNAVVHLDGTETITGAKTFTAALAGASATFSGNVLIASSNSTLTLKPTTVSSGGSILFRGTLTGGSEQFQGFISAIPQSSTANTSDLSFNTYNAGTIVEGLRIAANGSATFSAALSGTSATLSGNLTMNANNSSAIKFTNAAGSGTAWDMFADATNNSYFRNTTSGFIFTNNTTNFLTIANTGISTFSGGVVANNYTSTNGNNSNAFNSASATTGWVQISMNNTSGTALLGIEGSTAGTVTNGSLAYATILRNSTNTALQLATNNIVRTTITSDGNVGIGLTPFANTIGKSLDLVNGGGIFASSNNFYVTGNAYFDSAWKYKATSGAAFININSGGDGSIGFVNAPSGTAGNNISFVERMKITNGGDVGIGNSGFASTRLTTTGSSNTSSHYSIVANNASNANLFWIRCDGLINTGLSAASPYNQATTGRSMVIESTGSLGYLVSTRESKANIESIKSIDFVNQLNPVQFNYRKKDADTNEFTDELYDNLTYGFIADEVEKVNKELVFYKEDGVTLAGVEYNNMIAILTKAVQELGARVKELEAK